MTSPKSTAPSQSRDLAAEDLTCDAITADFRIYQRRRGHRFSLDDLATAWDAVAARPDAQRYVDLGCGIGSVLHMVVWSLRRAGGLAFALGVEAQAASLALCRRSLAHNRIEALVTLWHGDLREVAAAWREERVDLVTGTPPYLPLGTAVVSPDPQRAGARMELLGGVEDYLAAAARLLRPSGRAVICADGRRPERVVEGARAAGLVPLRRRDLWPHAGAQHPLLSVWTLAPLAGAAPPLEHLRTDVRDPAGARTAEALAMRAAFGL
ncbi:MAG: methyltransferase [Myxococcales bacterium]|nr:methyltransferase [Myxococcales bacterium]